VNRLPRALQRSDAKNGKQREDGVVGGLAEARGECESGARGPGGVTQESTVGPTLPGRPDGRLQRFPVQDSNDVHAPVLDESPELRIVWVFLIHSIKSFFSHANRRAQSVYSW
jgi:hypothetical protein